MTSGTWQDPISEIASPPYFFFPLQFHVIASYPRVWNMPQSWQCEIEVYKATYHFIYAQKNFFTGESPSARPSIEVSIPSGNSHNQSGTFSLSPPSPTQPPTPTQPPATPQI